MAGLIKKLFLWLPYVWYEPIDKKSILKVLGEKNIKKEKECK